MSEKRKAAARITVKGRDDAPVKIELFPAEQWDPSAAGLYRLRIDGKWREDAGRFCSPPEFTELFSRALNSRLAKKAE